MSAHILAPSRGGTRILTPDEMRAYLSQHVRETETGCRVWGGHVSRHRVPVVNWGGRRYAVRRLILQLSGRRLHGGWVVWTSCATPGCVRPEHLRAGSRRQHVAAQTAAGRVAAGTVHSLAIARGLAGRARMPASARFEVARMRADGWTWARIGAHYGVTLSAAQKQLANWERVYGPAGNWGIGRVAA